MSSSDFEPKGELHQSDSGDVQRSEIVVDGKHETHHAEKVHVDHGEIVVDASIMNDAVDGENREHAMSIWAAAKKHPWACLYAFIMCFTIVSPFATFITEQELIPARSWSRSICF